MKLIGRTRTNQLIEFQDGDTLRRVWIPAELKPTLEIARRGIDVGPRLEDIEELGLAIDAKKLLHGLCKRGIWTEADVRRPGGGSKVRSALLEGLGWAVSQLMNLYLDRR